jgi:hypothetical protein
MESQVGPTTSETLLTEWQAQSELLIECGEELFHAATFCSEPL